MAAAETAAVSSSSAAVVAADGGIQLLRVELPVEVRINMYRYRIGSCYSSQKVVAVASFQTFSLLSFSVC